MDRARRRRPLNWGTIGKIETVLDIRDRRRWPLESKFKPHCLVDFNSRRCRIENHPISQAGSDIYWRPNRRACNSVATHRRCGELVQSSRRKTPEGRLERARGVISTWWQPGWYRRACCNIWNREGEASDWAWCDIWNRRARGSGWACSDIQRRRSCR